MDKLPRHHIVIEADFEQQGEFSFLGNFHLSVGGVPENLLTMSLEAAASIAERFISEHPPKCECIALNRAKKVLDFVRGFDKQTDPNEIAKTEHIKHLFESDENSKANNT